MINLPWRHSDGGSESAWSGSTWEKRRRHTWGTRSRRRSRRSSGSGIGLGDRAVNSTVCARICGCCSGRRGIVRTHQCPVRRELGTKFHLRQHSVVVLGFFWWWLGDRSRIESELDFLATLVICNVRHRNSFHTEDFDFVAISSR